MQMPSINANIGSLPIQDVVFPQTPHSPERYLVANVPHARMDSADFNHVARSRCVNHLAIANVDTRMVAVQAEVARLGIGNAFPACHGVRGAPVVAHLTGDAVSNQARAVEGIRASCTPYIGLAKLSIGAIYYRVTCYGLNGAVVYRTAPIVL